MTRGTKNNWNLHNTLIQLLQGDGPLWARDIRVWWINEKSVSSLHFAVAHACSGETELTSDLFCPRNEKGKLAQTWPRTTGQSYSSLLLPPRRHLSANYTLEVVRQRTTEVHRWWHVFCLWERQRRQHCQTLTPAPALARHFLLPRREFGME